MSGVAVAEHDGWIWQGRQYHGWFGHGTKPVEATTPATAVATLDERIAALPRVAVASLPAQHRHHRSARFEGAAAGQLVRAMGAWIKGLRLSPEQFASVFFDSSPNRPGIENLHRAAAMTAAARTHADMRSATDQLAAGMMAVGLDNWPHFLEGADERTKSRGIPSAMVTGSVQPIGGASSTEMPAGEDRVDSVGSVRVLGGSADLVAGPTTRGESTAEILDVEGKIAAIAEQVKSQVEPETVWGMSARDIGTMLHTKFRKAVDDAVRRGELPNRVRTEQSYVEGVPARYGFAGSFRTDVLLADAKGKVIAIWDYKTGGQPTIPTRRIDQLRQSVMEDFKSPPDAYFRVLHVPFYRRPR